MDSLKCKPLGARVLVEKYKENKQGDITIDDMVIDETALEKTDSGLFLTSKMEDATNVEFKKTSGRILSLGTGLSEDAKNNLSLGTLITFQSAHPITYKGKEYYMIHENNINLIISDTED